MNVGPDGKVRMSEYEDDVREAIRIVIGTSKGERAMRPDFGCGIHDLVFSQINAATASLVKSTVSEALAKWEPRIDVLKVDVSDEEAGLGKLLIKVEYRVRSTNNMYNMVYPFYVREG